MNLTVDISADLEPRLLQEAAKYGVEPGEYILGAVRERLHESRSSGMPSLTQRESRLMEEINRGHSQAEWDRYYELVRRRQSDSMSEQEIEELTAVSIKIEELNARRMERLAELAQLRGATLPELLDHLGIVPPPVM